MRRFVVLASLVAVWPSFAHAQTARGVAWARITSNGSSVPAAFQYNSAGGTITVSRTAAGAYTLLVPNWTGPGGTTHVTAVNGSHYCAVEGWLGVAGGASISVRCYASAGTPADGDVNVLHYREARAETTWNAAYVWANLPASASYTPNLVYQWNAKGTPNTVARSGPGFYSVTVAGRFDSPAPGVLVSSYGSAAARCGVYGAGTAATSQSTTVTCQSAAGAFADSQFTFSDFTDTAFGAFQGEDQLRGAFMYSDQLSATGVARSQWSAAGQPLKVRYIAVGRYAVDIGGLAPSASSIAMVSKYANGSCSVRDWMAGPPGGTTVLVDCYNISGVPEDAAFFLTFLTSDRVTSPLAITGALTRGKAWVMTPSGADPTPIPRHSFNSTGATNTAARLRLGRYVVTFPGLATSGGIVHVNTVGSNDVSCKPTSWGPAGTALEVYVSCAGLNGLSEDSAFAALFYKESRTGAADNAGYARVLTPIMSATPQPLVASWNGRGATTRISRTTVGRYSILFDGFLVPLNGGSVMVTSYGRAQERCRVLGWTETNVAIACYLPDGTPIDVEFGVSVYNDVAFAAASVATADPGAYLWANQTSQTALYSPDPVYRFNSSGDTLQVRQAVPGAVNGVSEYEARVGTLKWQYSSIAIVTPYGSGAGEVLSRCSLISIAAPTAPAIGATVRSGCSATGFTGATRYTLTYLTSPGTGAPALSAIADRSVARSTSTGAMSFTLSDDAYPSDSLTVAATSSNTTLVPQANVVLAGTGINRTVTVTPVAGLTGNSTITITATDPDRYTGSEPFVVTVVPPSFTLNVLKAGAGTGVGSGTVTSNQAGISCGSTCSAPFPEASTVTLTATPDAGSSFAGWTGSGCSGTSTCVVTMGAAKTVTAIFGLLPKTYYLAEGATGSFFDLDIVIANPGDGDVPVEMTFLDAGGNTYPYNFTLGAKRTRTVAVETAVPALANADVSTIVRSPSGQPLVVERSLFWDASYYGGHTGSAVDGPQTTWYFGEGFQSSPVFDTFILLANANNAPANVTLTFLRQGGTPIVTTKVVPATARANFWAAELPATLNGQSFSTVVTSDIPIIAERAMYFGTPFFNGGHESAGVAAPSMNWFHAEGRTGPFFDTYILIGNPGATPANVTVRFLRANDTPITTTLAVAAQSRETIYVDGIPGLPNNDVSTEVTSDAPVISERAMYWPGEYAQWYEAHNSFGVTSTGLAWGLAEGRFGFPQQFETYILLTNPTATPTRVRVTFLRQGSKAPIVSEQLLGANARANADMSALLNAPDYDAAGERFGALVESLDNVGIVVERALYFTTGGVFWAGGTNATAVKIR